MLIIRDINNQNSKRVQGVYLSMNKKSVVKTAQRQDSIARRFDALREIPLFAELPDHLIRKLLESARQVSLRRGEMLFHAGDEANGLFVVLEGWIKLYQTDSNGQETMIRVVGGRQTFGEASMFDGHSYPVSAEAAAPTRLLSIPERVFFELIEEDAGFHRVVLNTLSRRLRYLVGEVGLMKSHNKSSCERLSRFLLEHCPIDESRAQVNLPFSKGLLAANLGMTQATLSRVLGRLDRAGVISQQGRRIQVNNITALREYC